MKVKRYLSESAPSSTSRGSRRTAGALHQPTLEAVAEFIRKHRVDIDGQIVPRKKGEVIPTYDYELIRAIQGRHIEDRQPKPERTG